MTMKKMFLSRCGAVAISACSGTSRQPTPIPLQPTVAPSADVPATSYVLSGTVLAGGVPLVGAFVDLVGQAGHFTTTTVDGKFSMFDLPKGSVSLRAGKPGFQAQITPIVVDGNKNYALTLAPEEPPQALAVGTRIMSVVKQDDRMCATSDPHVEEGDAGLGLVGPCKTFQLTIPEDGILVATATWPSKDTYMTVLTPIHGICCWSPLTLSFAVTAGFVIELSVGLHGADALPLDATAPFELITRLDTQHSGG